MQRGAWAGMVAVAGFAALAFAGDDAKTYDIDAKEKWKAGQTVTVTAHETSDTDMKMGEKPMRAEHEVLDAVYVERCDEPDAAGVPVKRTVFVKSWKKTKDGKPDESLAGALVTIDGKTWKLADGRTPGPLAKKWLDSTFAKNSEDPLSSLVPAKMSVGQTWKPDPKDVSVAFGKALEDAPFDASGVTMEVTLVSVEGTPPDARGKFTWKVHLPITSIPKLPPGSKLAAGSGAEATGERTGPMTTSTMLGVQHSDIDLKMVVEMGQQAQGMTVTTTGKIVQDKTTVAGGEIPAAPPPAAPKPAPAPGGK